MTFCKDIFIWFIIYNIQTHNKCENADDDDQQVHSFVRQNMRPLAINATDVIFVRKE